MPIKALGLRTTVYMVNDLPKAIEWYTQAFGIAPYFNEPFYVGFNIAGYELGLQPNSTPPSEKHDNIYTYWGVDNAHESYNTLLELGATPLEEPHDVGDDIIVAAVKDPWGNALGIIYNPHFSIPASK